MLRAQSGRVPSVRLLGGEVVLFPGGRRTNSSFPLFPWCRDSACTHSGEKLPVERGVQDILPIHKAQLLSYMRPLDVLLGLIINFHELKPVDGLVRMILPGANR